MNKQFETQERRTDTSWNRQARNLTTFEPTSNQKVEHAPRQDVPLSACHGSALTDKGGRVQPLRAHHNIRKKFLTDKIFSPVLHSQHSGQAAGSNQAIHDVAYDARLAGSSYVPEQVI